MAARTQTRRNGADPLKRASKTLDRELKRVDDLKTKLDADTRARMAELDDERERITNARRALGLDSPPARRGRPPGSTTRRRTPRQPAEVQA